MKRRRGGLHAALLFLAMLAAGCGLAYPIVAIVAVSGGGGGGGGVPQPRVPPDVQFLGAVGGTQSGSIEVLFTVNDVFTLPCSVTVSYSLDDATFLSASGAIFLSSSPPPGGAPLKGSLATGIGNSYLFVWDSSRDLPTQATPAAILRFVATDPTGLKSDPADTSIAVDNQLHADLVLGQQNLTIGALDNRGFDEAVSVLLADGHLWAADYSNHRVVQFNAVPAFSFQGATLALGQPSFTTAQPNLGTPLPGVPADRQPLLIFPSIVAFDDTTGRLFVGAIPNIYIWDRIPTATGQPPDRFVTVNGSSDNDFTGIAAQGEDLYVSIFAEQSLVRYSLAGLDAEPGFPEGVSITSTAEVLIDPQTTYPIENPVTAFPFAPFPWGVRIVASGGAGYSLVASDQSDYALLVWNQRPAAGAQPDFVINLLTQDTGNEVAPTGFYVAPQTGSPSDGMVYVGSGTGARIGSFAGGIDGQGVLLVSGLTTTATVTTLLPVDFVGTPSGSNVANDKQQSLSVDISGDDQHLVVADDFDNRILIFDPVPTTGNPVPVATAALGQTDLESSGTNHAGIDPFSFNFPSGIASDGTRLFVADTRNRRVLVWNTLPDTNGRGASFCLGQRSLFESISFDPQNDPPNRARMNGPRAVMSDGQHVFVADPDTSRVLIWTTMPTASGVTADAAIFLVQAGLQPPMGVAFEPVSRTLAISDFRANRVLVWHNFSPEALAASSPPELTVDPSSVLQPSDPLVFTNPPDTVLGQPDGVSQTALNPDLPPAARMLQPGALSFDTQGRLYVCDGARFTTFINPDEDPSNFVSHGRVLVFSSATTSRTSGQAADIVVVPPTTDALGATGAPSAVTFAEGKLIAVDFENERVVFWDWDGSATHAPQTSSISGIFGQRSLGSSEINQGGVTDHSLYLSNPADPLGDSPLDNPRPGVVVTGSGASAVMWVVDGRNDRVLRVSLVRPGN